MIISFLAWAIIIAAFLQKDELRHRAALCFILPLLLSELSAFFIRGEDYYIYSGLIAMSIVLLLKSIGPVIRLTLALQLSCIAAILLNMIGWLCFNFKLKPFFYECAFVVLYSIILYLMLVERGKSCVGFSAFTRWDFSIYRNASAIARRVFNHKRKIQQCNTCKRR